ncbi:MAG TPA: TlpA disulfide reductase family protein [Candidatus Rifleibacterium sp.]|nr:TlpA disulfide reductase family protein [Candidatus Rifleibacterium sp.]
MKKVSLLVFALFIFCFGFCVPGCTQSVGSDAPEVTATTWINTDGFKLADHKDKVVVVEFWATWCPPCRKSIPHLKTMHDAHKDQGLVIVSLSDEPAETINEFNKKAGMDWIIGAGSSSGRDYGVSGIPTAFVVVDGKIVWNGHPMGGLEEEVKKQLEAKGAKAPAAPASSEAVAAPTEPAAVETPAPAAEPAAPAATETPAASTEEPAAPATTEEPAASAAPAATETPAPAAEPAASETEIKPATEGAAAPVGE